MAKKERILTSLRAAESELSKAARTGSKKSAANVLQNLESIRDICCVGLPENAYAEYGEIYDGLILAVEQMTKAEELRLSEDVFSLSRELLQYLIRKTEEDTGFKKDIVFLPYKSSMWDSLESVWKAAYEDKDHCNAYVVPIPYADLNPDRSVAEWHCERNQFPKYVPTLDWQTVDLEKMHPDVIFIHSPYDEYNRVTSVESRYYSSNLKKCTGKLIYIPYFVLEEPKFDSKSNEEIEKMEDGIAHFITTPAVLNADQVIVQSEAMRRVYIDVLVRVTNQKERAFWEKRILGLGSPKFDKVLISKKEDFKLPKAWRKIIKSRKIVLYNTSLTQLLKYREKYIQKIKKVLLTFKRCADVVLWWRPHPLLEATFNSMLPEEAEKYRKLRQTYVNENWGIYDDTEDLHRAICWSDGYYGDGSSVVQIYRMTGKPMLIQNVEYEGATK